MTEPWWVDSRRRDMLLAVAPLSVKAWIARAHDGVVLSSDRQSVAVHLPDVGLFVKWRHTDPGRRRKTVGRPSRERREAQSALCARALGIPGPRPWAVGEVRQAGMLLASVLIRPFDDDAQSASDALADGDVTRAQMAAQLRRWHDTGWRHGDCYPKNVLLLGDDVTLAPVGYPSAQFREPSREASVARPDPARVKDIAQLCVGLGACEEGTTHRLLTAYAPDAADRLAEPVARRIATILQRKSRRAQNRDAREPSGPPQPSPFAKQGRTEERPLLDLV